MNVALFTDTYPPFINGVSTSVYNLANTLKKHGHSVLVICPRTDEGDISFEDGVLRIPGIELKKLDGYKRDGVNLFKQEKITFSQAVLGDNIKIETLDGEADLSISPYTQTDTILKIKNKGVPYLNDNSKRGDLYIKLVVSTPTSITEDEKKLYSRLFEIENNKKSKENNILEKVKDAIRGK